MNWTDVEHCTPWTDEEVLCKVVGYDIDYVIGKYIDGEWWTYTMGYHGQWETLPRGAVIKWCHIHE